MGRHSVGEPDKTGVGPDGGGQPWRTVPPRNQQPMPPCTRCGAPFAAHIDDRCPQAETATDHVTAQQSATGTPTLPSPVKNNKKRLRVILAFVGVAIAVALGVSIYAIKASTVKTNTANVCVTWESSGDGQVVDESVAYRWGCDTTILTLSPQDGGAYGPVSKEPLPHGSQVCSVTGGAPGYKTTDIVYQGITGDSAEAENLCAAMGSAVNGDAVPPPDPASSPVDSTSTQTPAPVETETTPTAPATMSSTDYQGLYKEAYQETATDYQGGQTPAAYHESDSQFCMTTIEGSLGNEEPIYAGCMAALSAQQ